MITSLLQISKIASGTHGTHLQSRQEAALHPPG